jgi:RNA polymerase sigma factor (sigma-70 family)
VEGPPLEDADLARRAGRGQVEAYEELVRRYQGLAHRTAYVVTGSAADAEDAAQAAFVKAWYAMERFDPERPFRPWLLRIVANEAKNRRRAGARHAALELEAVGERPPEAPSPEEESLAEERRAALLRAVNGLRPDDRLVIAYRYFMELSESEMAEVMGVAPGTVKSRLSRALGRLRKALARGGFDLATMEGAV